MANISSLILSVFPQVIIIILILKMRKSIRKQVGSHSSTIRKIWNKNLCLSVSKTVFLTTKQLFSRVTKANPLPLPAKEKKKS